MCPWRGNEVCFHAWPTTSPLWRKSTLSLLLVWLLTDANEAFGCGEQLLHGNRTSSSVPLVKDVWSWWGVVLRGSGITMRVSECDGQISRAHTVSRFQQAKCLIAHLVIRQQLTSAPAVRNLREFFFSMQDWFFWIPIQLMNLNLNCCSKYDVVLQFALNARNFTNDYFLTRITVFLDNLLIFQSFEKKISRKYK